MRVTSMVAALALVLAACGGEKADNNAMANAPMDNEPAGAVATAGATHDVDMTMVDGQPRFVPAEINAKPGDVIRFHNKEGGPHNVKFWGDSLPANGAGAISIDRSMGPLETEMLVDMGAVVTVTLNNAPAGRYPFTCVPHQAMGMHGSLMVQ